MYGRNSLPVICSETYQSFQIRDAPYSIVALFIKPKIQLETFTKGIKLLKRLASSNQKIIIITIPVSSYRIVAAYKIFTFIEEGTKLS